MGAYPSFSPWQTAWLVNEVKIPFKQSTDWVAIWLGCSAIAYWICGWISNRYGKKIAVPLFAGLHVFKADKPVCEKLVAQGALLAQGKLVHAYPHSWRSKAPLIYRATPQWFIAMDHKGLRTQALEEIQKVDWIPDWGQARIEGMVGNRPDWCVSRQRNWGVPIALFVHRETQEPHPDSLALIEKVAQKIEQRGIDAWFDLDPAELLGDDAVNYRKVKDTLDPLVRANFKDRFGATVGYLTGLPQTGKAVRLGIKVEPPSINRCQRMALAVVDAGQHLALGHAVAAANLGIVRERRNGRLRVQRAPSLGEGLSEDQHVANIRDIFLAFEQVEIPAAIDGIAIEHGADDAVVLHHDVTDALEPERAQRLALGVGAADGRLALGDLDLRGHG